MPVSRQALAAALGVAELERRPWPYASTLPMEEVHLADGRAVLVKELDPGAAPSRPSFLSRPQRELEAYTTVLQAANMDTPSCVAIEGPPGRAWLVLELVDGVPLWQIGELDAWEEAARWLARLHAKPLLDAPGLPTYDASHLRRRFDLAGDQLPPLGTHVADRLASLPRSLVHGEFTASNIVIQRDGDRTRVRSVDWEMCGVGPGVLDLAALTAGSWDETDRARIERAYADACPPERRPSAEDVEYGRLLLAAQWLGWSPGWTPPPEHARDWRAEGLASIARLGL